MDVLVQNGVAHELFPNGAPELHPALQVIKNYSGPVQEGWEWDGSVFVEPPAEPAPTMPDTVTMRQARLSLNDAGLLDLVEAAVAVADKAVQIEWEFASTIERYSPTTTMIAAACNLTDEEVDSLFLLAGQK